MKPQTIFKSPQGREAILAKYDQILARWPVPYQTHQLPTRHGETFVLTCGDEAAPSLALLHGSSSNSAMWVGDAGIFSARYRVIAVDLPGEPGKSQPIRSELGGPAYAEWLKDVLAGLGVDRIRLAGISLGGWMSIKFATTYPERVERLVLFCPGGVVPIRNLFMWKALLYRFLNKRVHITDQTMHMLNAGRPLEPETIKYSQLINAHFNMRLEALPLFPDAELKKLTMPVRLVGGIKDPLMDIPKTVARLHALLPSYTADILPEAGHILVNMAERVMPFLTAGKDNE